MRRRAGRMHRQLDALGTLDDLCFVLDRARTCHNIEVAGADLAARNLDDRVLGMEFAVDGLKRLGHALYTLDHVIRHNVPFIEPGRVAHQAEDKCIRTLGIVDPQPHIRECCISFSTCSLSLFRLSTTIISVHSFTM